MTTPDPRISIVIRASGYPEGDPRAVRRCQRFLSDLDAVDPLRQADVVPIDREWLREVRVRLDALSRLLPNADWTRRLYLAAPDPDQEPPS